MIDKSLLDGMIIGRVEPHIYAFSTNTIPNYLKVGDTYRPVSIRLEEWKKHFPELKKEFEQIAKVDDNSYFRDFSVHEFLENEKHRQRLTLSDTPEGVYYSKEFFKNATKQEVEDAIADIKQNYENKTNKYHYYNAETLRVDNYTYPRTETYEPRPNQDKTIQKFKQAVANGRTNLLMYAVMRFGKSFTSMCCAVENNAKLVVVVSAKADVREEWKKTVESHVKFIDYEFYDSRSLQANPHIITETLAQNKKTVLFLTLQDLSTENIKEKHQDIFGQDIDLLLIDESHFGARAEKFGKVLRDTADRKASTHKHDDFVDIDEAQEEINKTFKAKIKLHLSGTPYRILMGSEFEAEDIIAFYQFTDIVQEQEKWNEEHLLDDDYKEWDNPYYGFPQMIRFAFNPSESARKKMEEMSKNGVSYAFSALLKPRAIKKVNDNLHKEFEHKEEILELLEVIDGSKEDNEVLGFLDYDNIKNGKMCRHIVMVLPYCASCDAMEKLIKDNTDKFKNLNEYEIINISGVDNQNLYKTTDAVKRKITECETSGKKTITLTVNRMLTGTTVQEWDTMIYLKDTASPQDYDQSIFRLQNQYIKKYKDESGDIIKYNMKPQTLLVDFAPNRVFSMQEQKAQIYNVNVDDSGNSKLAERIREELRISPIICINKNKIEEITPNDIMKAVSEYSKTRGVAEETIEIPVDLSLLEIDAIKNVIEQENELGSKAGLSVKASSGEGDDMDVPDTNTPTDIDDNTEQAQIDTENDTQNDNEDNSKNPEKQFRNYFARILFYSFLTEDTVISLQEIINTTDTENNTRILKNLGLNKQVLELMLQHMDKWALRKLDYKIQNINKLSHDDSVQGVDSCNVAVSKFGKLGESEVLTPNNICNDMINLITDEQIKAIIDNGEKILDIASKAGEFAVAIYQRLKNLGYSQDTISNSIYSIPTSTITYEFTRKIYEVLGLNIGNIAENFTSYDLLQCKNNQQTDYDRIEKLLTQYKSFNEITLTENITEGGNTVKFGAVVGNPPYQEETKVESTSNGQNPRKNIFHHFQLQAMKLAKKQTVLIFPGTRWIHQSGKGLKQFGLELINKKELEEIIFYPNSKDVFDSTDVSDGISIVVTNKDKDKSGFKYTYITKDSQESLMQENPGNDLLLIKPQDITIATKIKSFVSNRNLKYLHDSILQRSLFGIESDFIEKNKSLVREYTSDEDVDFAKEIKLLTNDKAGSAGRSCWFVVNKDIISQNINYINEWQVVVSSAHPGGQDGRDNQIAIIDNHSAFGRARVALKSFKTKIEAENFIKYMTSNMIKYALLLSDEALSALARFVPDLGDYTRNNSILDFSKNIDEQLIQILGIDVEELNYIKSQI